MSVDALREQLKERGYLTHGIERWFALDPWSSRAFWLELLTVALKAATLIAAFGALPMTAVMLFRNRPLGALETLGLFASYAAAWFVLACAFVMIIALILKIRPALPIDTPAALLAISCLAAALLAALIGTWWFRFDTVPEPLELFLGGALGAVFFLVSTITISAALLSFSIYEVRRIPLIHARPRGVPMGITALLLTALLFAPALAERDRPAPEPMVVTTPTATRVALVAVDGLTSEILSSRADLVLALPHRATVPSLPGSSTTERWATIGTGVKTDAHGVRAIEGVRFRGTSHLLQRISSADSILMNVLPALRIARREPLPPTVRRREYAWEIVAERGVPSISINWWATADAASGALQSVGPESVFTASKGDALLVDTTAAARFTTLLDRNRPRFATVYLPALDVVLNRLELDRSAQLTQSLGALENLAVTVAKIRERGYEVILVGMPGDGQKGGAIIASTLPVERAASTLDVTPTILDLLGFPLSVEMPGRSLASRAPQPRIATYGNRADPGASQKLNEEYYQNLKSLGYIR